jgi:hypothetical protein
MFLFNNYVFFILFCLTSFPGISLAKSAVLKRNVSQLIHKIPQAEKAMAIKLNNEISNVKSYTDVKQTSKAVSAAIESIKTISKNNPQSETAQIYRIAVQNIPLLKGFIYRMRKIVETSDLGYITSIYFLRKYKQTSSFRAEYMDALFELMTSPNDGEDILGQKGIFENTSQMQEWIITKLAPKFHEGLIELKSILSKHHPEDPLYMADIKLLVGNTTLSNMRLETDKTKLVTVAHMYSWISTFENFLGLIYYIGSYNLNSLGDFYNQINFETFQGKKATFSDRWAMATDVTGLVSSARIGQMLKSPKEFGPASGTNDSRDPDHKLFLTIRPEANRPIILSGVKYDHYFQIAKMYFTAALEDQLLYHQSMLKMGQDEDSNLYILSPKSYKGLVDAANRFDTEKILQSSLLMIRSDSPTLLQDRIIKKEYSINISALFDPSKMSDLRSFYPNRFEDEWEKRPESPPFGASLLSNKLEAYKKSFKWNYNFGKPISWPDPTFGGLLPDGKKHGEEDEFVLYLTNISSQPEIPYVAFWLSLFYAY